MSAANPDDSQKKSGLSQNQLTIRVVLLVILALAIVGLIQDRLRARPAVEQAYETIEELNRVAVGAAGSHVTSTADIQQALGRKPSRVDTVKDFTVEVYSWRAGLPWKTHDYYAVYGPGESKPFITHYKFIFDPKELTDRPVDESLLPLPGMPEGK